ncbi:hypothetical protein DSL92_06845 [Billgrantia gudaonensis]|uniref:Uncharacterized protein n=1 Tax=Billgrantia gudaonensis TaxID=376427 RepID=A0A432JIJ2_9GAMM|nr:hypothetical protein DSL92_06845 [Halomonas gudaonensis]
MLRGISGGKADLRDGGSGLLFDAGYATWGPRCSAGSTAPADAAAALDLRLANDRLRPAPGRLRAGGLVLRQDANVASSGPFPKTSTEA